MGFQDSSRLLILAASVLDISCGKTDTQTNGGKNLLPRLPAAWVINYFFAGDVHPSLAYIVALAANRVICVIIVSHFLGYI